MNTYTFLIHPGDLLPFEEYILAENEQEAKEILLQQPTVGPDDTFRLLYVQPYITPTT